MLDYSLRLELAVSSSKGRQDSVLATLRRALILSQYGHNKGPNVL